MANALKWVRCQSAIYAEATSRKVGRDRRTEDVGRTAADRAVRLSIDGRMRRKTAIASSVMWYFALRSVTGRGQANSSTSIPTTRPNVSRSTTMDSLYCEELATCSPEILM